MSIKMRYNNDANSVCCECGDKRNQVLEMLDVCVGGNIFTICDKCNEQQEKEQYLDNNQSKAH